MSSSYDEKSFVRKIVLGDQKAFSVVYDRYKPVLYRFVFNILKSDDLTNDTCQEVFIKIWEERAKLAEVNSFRYYLLTVGKNHSLNILKKILSEERNASLFIYSCNEISNDLEEQVESDEYQCFISSVLSTLTPQSRRVFMLCRQQGLSYDEAAETMGVSRNIIKKHMVRSMKIFRTAMQKDLGIAFNFLILSWLPSQM
ncbi:RNA polymerase sigma-70 factor [Dyadobacter luteus]|uniref:RNA polymerase sigma-70 factor n=1 Tax=Dyadobacter luteus TaxID=2259619 RepID=A0A3D8YFL2_9BACT|nr:sigma-70 family RNA polymerase sigma factor [Dyadobacter luteus]REA63465.1 RNA polymerase sigma-70 factor [Dyadobacter luteus]